MKSARNSDKRKSFSQLYKLLGKETVGNKTIKIKCLLLKPCNVKLSETALELDNFQLVSLVLIVTQQEYAYEFTQKVCFFTFYLDHMLLQGDVAHVKFEDLTLAVLSITSPKLCIRSWGLNLLSWV